MLDFASFQQEYRDFLLKALTQVNPDAYYKATSIQHEKSSSEISPNSNVDNKGDDYFYSPTG